MNKVSCITVTKNRTTHLEKCINYFINQTHSDKELIIVYYNTDLVTYKYLKAQQERLDNNNIKIHKFIEDEGLYLGATRNYAITKATGDWLCIWDDDDFYSNDRIEQQLKFCVDNDLIGCTLRSILIFSNKHQKFKCSFEREGGWEGSLLIRKEEMPKYKNLKSGEDTPVIDKLLGNRFKTMFNPDLYVYMFHDDNISGCRHKENILDNSFDLNIKKTRELKEKIDWI